MLLNALDLVEGTITENNYDEMLQMLNSTSPESDIIQGPATLKTFLSGVCF